MYTLSPRSFIVQSPTTGATWLLRDVEQWEDLSDEQIHDHFNNVHALMLERIQALKSPHATISDYEEKELNFMLEALVHAKRLLSSDK